MLWLGSLKGVAGELTGAELARTTRAQDPAWVGAWPWSSQARSVEGPRPG